MTNDTQAVPPQSDDLPLEEKARLCHGRIARFSDALVQQRALAEPVSRQISVDLQRSWVAEVRGTIVPALASRGIQTDVAGALNLAGRIVAADAGDAARTRALSLAIGTATAVQGATETLIVTLPAYVIELLEQTRDYVATKWASEVSIGRLLETLYDTAFAMYGQGLFVGEH